MVRLREGYDLAEVDAFLARVETSLSVLWHDNTALRDRLAAAERVALDTVTAARRQAGQILAEAHACAEQVQRDAMEAADVLAARAGYREVIEGQIDRLETVIADHDRNLRQGVRTQLAQLRGLLDDPEPRRATFQQAEQAGPPGPPGAHAARDAAERDQR